MFSLPSPAICVVVLGQLALSACRADCECTPAAANAVEFIELNDNGAWSWFSDNRAIVLNGQLLVASIRSHGDYQETRGLPGWGNVELAALDIDGGEVHTTVLVPQFEQDDHAGPALLPGVGGRLLAVYTKHGVERTIYFQHTIGADPLRWGPVSTFTSPGLDSAFKGDNVTYTNLFRWPNGHIYNFYRGYEHDPNYMFSIDGGRSWIYGGRLLAGRDGYAPYLRYAYDGDGTLHFIATEDHPRHYDTSIFHGFLRHGVIHDSHGKALSNLSHTTAAPLSVWDLTRVYAGDEDHVAWVVDIELDDAGLPYVVFSIQRDGAGLPYRQGGMDLRYHYARFNGHAWSTEQLAHAGTRLYAREEDYSGLAALDPIDPNIVYISTNADPITGTPLISASDCERHHELFRGRRPGPGHAWSWDALTVDSDVDNLRPIVPKWDDPRTALVWMRGTYVRAHGEWSTQVVAAILERERLATVVPIPSGTLSAR